MSGKKLICKALEGRAMSVRQITDELKMRRRTVTHYMREMREAEPKLVHVVSWVDAQTPIYALGDGPDKPAPRPLTRKRRRKREYTRLKRDPEKMLIKMQHDRKYKAKKRMERMQRDPLMAALFGGK